MGYNVVIGTECRIYTQKPNVDTYTEVTGGAGYRQRLGLDSYQVSQSWPG